MWRGRGQHPAPCVRGLALTDRRALPESIRRPRDASRPLVAAEAAPRPNRAQPSRRSSSRVLSVHAHLPYRPRNAAPTRSTPRAQTPVRRARGAYAVARETRRRGALATTARAALWLALAGVGDRGSSREVPFDRGQYVCSPDRVCAVTDGLHPVAALRRHGRVVVVVTGALLALPRGRGPGSRTRPRPRR